MQWLHQSCYMVLKFGVMKKNDISETLHLEFCKYIMKVKKCTPNYIVYELGGVPSYKCKDDWFLGTYCKR